MLVGNQFFAVISIHLGLTDQVSVQSKKKKKKSPENRETLTGGTKILTKY